MTNEAPGNKDGGFKMLAKLYNSVKGIGGEKIDVRSKILSEFDGGQSYQALIYRKKLV